MSPNIPCQGGGGGVSNPGAGEEDAEKYEFVSEHKFPHNIDDEVHVEICQQIGDPFLVCIQQQFEVGLL
jgi:guanylate kinase